MTKSRDAREDLIGGFRPDERLRGRVAHGDVGDDGGLKGTRAVMGAALDLFVRQQRKPAFDR
jgi:hypothetical protein